jgi:hypothetical protein
LPETESSVAKKAKIEVPDPIRPPDHVSKRGVNYWWAPEWTRGTNSTNSAFGKIKAVREPAYKNGPDTVNLYMVAKDGNATFIQGSIQEEFKQWHDDRQIDYILLGETPESASDLIISETEDIEYV